MKPSNLKEIMTLERLGRMEEALKEIEGLKESEKQEGELLKCRILVCAGKIDEAIDFSDDLDARLKATEGKNLDILKINILNSVALGYYFQNKLGNT